MPMLPKTRNEVGTGGATLQNRPDPELLLGLFEKMVLLRKFELAAQTSCRNGETPGFLHLYLGQEAVAAGICTHLNEKDWVTSTHRGHGHALAKDRTQVRSWQSFSARPAASVAGVAARCICMTARLGFSVQTAS